MKLNVDLAIIGSGFAGSLLAMVARRLGRTVVLLERARHPRFVIGESSTPLGNLLLEELSDRFDLPRVRALSKWGTWQREHPEVGCGLKRGFTFYHHRFGEPYGGKLRREDQLLVAASPWDDVADTHWYRPDFDWLLAQEAERLGAVHLQEVALDGAVFDADGGTLTGVHGGARLEVRAGFVVDGSGPRGFLFRTLGLPELALDSMPRTEGLYGHFRGVGRVGDALSGGAGLADSPPYPADDAALHHVFEGGWIWVLRFNNGLVSAGVAAETARAGAWGLHEGEAGWRRLLERLPIVRDQFQGARLEFPMAYSRGLSFRSGEVCGDRWALLPYAAGFIDPLLSTGFPLTLLGVARLAGVLEAGLQGDTPAGLLQDYARRTRAEFAAAERLVGALYASLGDFPLFGRLSLLYFAAATFTETARRLGRPGLAGGFLMHDHPGFGPAMRRLCEEVLRARTAGGLKGEARERVCREVLQAIRPIDVAGLAREDRGGWYPVDLDALMVSSAKMGASEEEVRRMLARCGLA